MSQRRFIPLPLILRKLQVIRTDDVTPRMRRVTLGGPELGAFHRDGHHLPAFASPAFDDHVKLIFAPGGDIADALPVQRARSIDWLPSAVRQTRDYTPVEVTPESVSFDFVVHSAGSDSIRGPAEAWATTAKPGDDLWVVGPKSSTVVPEEADWVLLAGDETALPAVRRFLAERPVDGPVRVVLTIADSSSRQDLGHTEIDEVIWTVAPPGDPFVLARAVEELERPTGRPYVWAAAESRSLLPIRKFAKRELGADKSNTDITGYWHRRTETPESPVEGAADRAAVETPRMDIVESPVTWLAVRAALRLGLLEAVDGTGPNGAGLDRDALAARLGVERRRLDALVDLLVGCRVLTCEDGVLASGEVGDDLLTDEHFREHFDGVDADTVLSLVDLAEALGAGESVWQRKWSRTYAQHVHANVEQFAELVDRSGRLTFLLPNIVELPAVAQPRLGLFGPGAVVVADELVGSQRLAAGADVVVVEEPAAVTALAATSMTGRVRFAHAWADHDTVVAVQAFWYRDDAEVTAVLAGLSGRTRRMVIVESVEGDALDPRYLEASLVTAAVVGQSPRDRDRLIALLAASGWETTEAMALGWGVWALVCVPK